YVLNLLRCPRCWITIDRFYRHASNGNYAWTCWHRATSQGFLLFYNHVTVFISCYTLYSISFDFANKNLLYISTTLFLVSIISLYKFAMPIHQLFFLCHFSRSICDRIRRELRLV